MVADSFQPCFLLLCTSAGMINYVFNVVNKDLEIPIHGATLCSRAAVECSAQARNISQDGRVYLIYEVAEPIFLAPFPKGLGSVESPLLGS